MSVDKFRIKQEAAWREYYLVIQGVFYFAQGAAMAALFLLPNFMIRKLGVSEPLAITYQTIIMLPWYVKLLFGLLSDNVGFKGLGRRKPYILFAGLLGVIGWFSLPAFNKINALFFIVGITLSLSVALSDAVIDSLAVDLTPEHRRGWMQGIGWGGRGVGTALAGFLLGITIDSINWYAAFAIPGALMIAACFLAFFFKEPEIVDSSNAVTFQWSSYKEEFTRKELWITTLFMLLAGSGIAIISTYSTFLEDTTELTMEGIGLGVTFFAIGQFVGAVIIGLLGNYLPLMPVLVANTTLYVGIIVSLLFIPLSNLTVLYIVICCFGAINGGYEATQMRIGMEYSQGPIGGSLYNWYMSVSNIGQIAIGANIIAALSGPLGGFPQAMQFASLFLLLGLVPAFFLVRWLKVKKKGELEKVSSVRTQEQPELFDGEQGEKTEEAAIE